MEKKKNRGVLTEKSRGGGQSQDITKRGELGRGKLHNGFVPVSKVFAYRELKRNKMPGGLFREGFGEEYSKGKEGKNGSGFGGAVKDSPHKSREGNSV